MGGNLHDKVLCEGEVIDIENYPAHSIRTDGDS